MLTLVESSGDKKTGPIPVTYRAGVQTFGTCPATCGANPRPEQSSGGIDWDYLADLCEAAPPKGGAWTYIHFGWTLWRPFVASLGARARTILNYSADTLAQAVESFRAGVPTVCTVPEGWHASGKVRRVDGVRFVQCPATVPLKPGAARITCGGGNGTRGCGGSGAPLCAREGAAREYVITFELHGPQRRLEKPCYAQGGNVRLHWDRTALKPANEPDGVPLRAWVKRLSPWLWVRHHVAGDIGKIG
jgi:hypothetical protein